MRMTAPNGTGLPVLSGYLAGLIELRRWDGIEFGLQDSYWVLTLSRTLAGQRQHIGPVVFLADLKDERGLIEWLIDVERSLDGYPWSGSPPPKDVLDWTVTRCRP